jgi:hypothetical protein
LICGREPRRPSGRSLSILARAASQAEFGFFVDHFTFAG